MKHFWCVLLLISFNWLFSQQAEIVDFTKIEAIITPKVENKQVEGVVSVSFTMLSAAKEVFLDAHQMTVSAREGRNVVVVAKQDKILIQGDFVQGQPYTVVFSYSATPKQTLYFTSDQVWTQGQGKYTSHWLPSLDDMNDKIEFDLTFVSEPSQTVIANGRRYEVDEEAGKKYWNYDMQQPMSSYLVAFAMGKFEHQTEYSASGIPIELYLRPEHMDRFEPTYRYTKDIFDFLEEEIGVAYPWQNYKQVPVRDFLYAGMENTTVTLFSEAFVVDSIGFTDRNYVNVNAHEMAHHWFGNLVTETSGTHHWLQEGFATYYALLAERQIFGDDYYYWKLYNTAEQLRELSEGGKGESLLNPKASSLTFYEKGAWALHMLRELIGDEAFRTAVKNYVKAYAYKNVTTDDFLEEVRKASEVGIDEWEADWLKQSAFKAEQAFNSLIKSPFMNRYFETAALAGEPLTKKELSLSLTLDNPNDYVGQEVVYQLASEDPTAALALYEKALQTGNTFIRQAVATTLQAVPKPLVPAYETLLDDPSYVTQEAALYHLWLAVPQNRSVYLDKMKSVMGFQDKNVRQLWLTLALVTQGYQTAEKSNYLQEITSYTSPEQSFEIRKTAFEYLTELQVYSEDVIRNLVDASVHHNWRFRNAARGLLDKAIAKPDVKAALAQMLPELSEKEKAFLNKKLLE